MKPDEIVQRIKCIHRETGLEIIVNEWQKYECYQTAAMNEPGYLRGVIYLKTEAGQDVSFEPSPETLTLDVYTVVGRIPVLVMEGILNETR